MGVTNRRPACVVAGREGDIVRRRHRDQLAMHHHFISKRPDAVVAHEWRKRVRTNNQSGGVLVALDERLGRHAVVHEAAVKCVELLKQGDERVEALHAKGAVVIERVT